MYNFNNEIVYYLDKSSKNIITCARGCANEVLARYRTVNPSADIVLLSTGDNVPVMGIDY